MAIHLRLLHGHRLQPQPGHPKFCIRNFHVTPTAVGGSDNCLTIFDYVIEVVFVGRPPSNIIQHPASMPAFSRVCHSGTSYGRDGVQENVIQMLFAKCQLIVPSLQVLHLSRKAKHPRHPDDMLRLCV